VLDDFPAGLLYEVYFLSLILSSNWSKEFVPEKNCRKCPKKRHQSDMFPQKLGKKEQYINIKSPKLKKKFKPSVFHIPA
jgi:hypothetical protein